MATEKRKKPVIRGDDAKRFLENERRVDMEIMTHGGGYMTASDTPEAAKIEAARREERERIIRQLGTLSICPNDDADGDIEVAGDEHCTRCWRYILDELDEQEPRL